jgi:hypothetical protein
LGLRTLRARGSGFSSLGSFSLGGFGGLLGRLGGLGLLLSLGLLLGLRLLLGGLLLSRGLAGSLLGFSLGLSFLLTLLVLGEELLVNVGHNTTGSDGDTTKELVQFFVVADSQLDVTGNDTLTLVVAGSVTGEFKNFGGQILEDSGEVDGSTTFEKEETEVREDMQAEQEERRVGEQGTPEQQKQKRGE